eukprot:2690159-Prorocentrum_lima.AAC.1
MTSSLVGSEMCIRDRPYHPAIMAAPGGSGGGLTTKNDDNEGWFTGDKTVSYTHLTLPTICSV